MKTILIAITILLFTACTAEPPEVGRAESQLTELQIDAWKTLTGCRVTPEEFIATVDPENNESPLHGATEQYPYEWTTTEIDAENVDESARTVCGTWEESKWINGEGYFTVCSACCIEVRYCEPFVGCYWRWVCSQPSCRSVDDIMNDNL